MIKAFTGTLVADLAMAGSASPVASAVSNIVGGESNVLGISFGGISFEFINYRIEINKWHIVPYHQT